MSDFFSSNSTLMLQRAMGFHWTKQQAILDNISNGDTPGYKAKYVTFEDALRSSIQQAARGENRLLNIRSALTAASPVVREADDESFRMDENGVDIASQQIELLRNAYQVQHVYRAISSDMSRVLMAIRGQ